MLYPRSRVDKFDRRKAFPEKPDIETPVLLITRENEEERVLEKDYAYLGRLGGERFTRWNKEGKKLGIGSIIRRDRSVR